MPTDTRSTVAEIMGKMASEASEEPVDTVVDVDAGSSDTGTSDSGGDASLGADPGAGTEAQRARDRKGRFKPGAAAKGNEAPRLTSSGAQAGAASGAPPGTAAPQAAVGAPAAPPAPVLPELKAPQDWRAAPREKWASLPREAQEEILRTYGDTRKTLDRAAALEKEIEPWRSATQPYAHVFGGAPPHQVIGGLLRSLSVLQTGHPQQRAQIAAAIVRDYIGTDEAALTMLGQAIHGAGAGQPVQAPQPMTQEQIRQLARQEWESAQAQTQRDAAIKTWHEFEPTAEFLEEPGFRQRLALELQLVMQENGGSQPTKDDIKKAHDAACQSHPGVSKIVNQRKEAAAAKAKNASTQAAAASGVKSEPAGPSGTEQANSTRDEVRKQWVRQSGKARV